MRRKKDKITFHENCLDNRRYATHLLERESAFNGRHDDRWWYICECREDSCRHGKTDQVTSARLLRVIDYYGLAERINVLLLNRIRAGKELDPTLHIVDYNSCEYRIKRLDRKYQSHRVTRRMYPVDAQHPVLENEENLFFCKELVEQPEQFIPEYGGRLWKFGDIEDKRFSAAYLLRLIEHFKIRDKIALNLLLLIEAGEVYEPNLFLLDYGSYKYHISVLNQEGATEKWQRTTLMKKYNMP